MLAGATTSMGQYRAAQSRSLETCPALRNSVFSHIERLQGPLHHASHIDRPEWFVQSYGASLIEKRLCLGIQRIASKEDKAGQKVWSVELQGSVQSWAVEFWHAQVAENEIVLAFLESCQGKMAIGGRLHPMAIAAEEVGQGFRDTLLVINHQYGHLRHGHGRWRLDERDARLGHGHHGDRQCDTKDRAMSCLTLHGDCAAVAFNDSLAEREAQPVPTPGGLVVKKGSKIRACSSTGMPRPVSATSNTTEVHVASACVVMVSWRDTAVSRRACWALVTRFSTTWCS